MDQNYFIQRVKESLTKADKVNSPITKSLIGGFTYSVKKSEFQDLKEERSKLCRYLREECSRPALSNTVPSSHIVHWAPKHG